MNLNDLAAFQSLDSSGLLSKIQAIPSQLEAAYHSGLSEPSSEVDYSAVRHILTVGLGEAVMGADLLAAYAADLLPIPWIIHRDEFLPAWAKGNETLIFVHPFGGVGREAGGLLAQSRQRGCQAIWLESPTPVRGVPPADASVGWYFGRLYAELERAGLLPALKVDLNEAVEAMQRSLAAVHTEVPVARNPAKRLAGQFYDRRVQLFAAGFLAPVARMWKMRINTFAKAGSNSKIEKRARM